MSATWTRKDLLGLRDMSREEIELILETAASFKEISAPAGHSGFSGRLKTWRFLTSPSAG